eukprot:scaffold102403_cov71-Phaeocystis_antarctica.AAC.6
MGNTYCVQEPAHVQTVSRWAKVSPRATFRHDTDQLDLRSLLRRSLPMNTAFYQLDTRLRVLLNRCCVEQARGGTRANPSRVKHQVAGRSPR